MRPIVRCEEARDQGRAAHEPLLWRSGRRNPQVPADRPDQARSDLVVARHGRGTGAVSAAPFGVFAAFAGLPHAVCAQVALEVTEPHPDRMRSSRSIRPAATLASSSSGESMRRKASMTFSRASFLVRPWLRAPGT